MSLTKLEKKVRTHSIARIAAYIIMIVGLFWIGISIEMNDIHANRRDAHGVCIEKFECYEGHRKSSRISSEFIMVVREDNGKAFDLVVTPSTYATTEIGDRVSFSSINKKKLGEPMQDNFGWVIFFCGLSMLMLICIGGAYDFLAAKDIREKYQN